MNPAVKNPVIDLEDAQAALLDLCATFAPAGFVPDGDVIPGKAVPPPSRFLLVHGNHMTVELQRHYGKPVEVHVFEEQHNGDIYTRKIGLTLSGTSHMVERGIARVHLRCLAPRVRDQILAKQTPLGAILIQNGVHRRVQPKHFVRFGEASSVIKLLDGGHNTSPVYGRLGLIYCNHEPAIELLEIVVNTGANPNP